ncbi:MAG: threonine--tRNA ligase [Candidatus Micrarchaeales archaeon]
MKIVQLDVDSIEYEPIEPESPIHEKIEKKKVVVKDGLVLLIAIEKDDTEAFASKAVKEALDFAAKQKTANIVLYPFAHLSSNLEKPQRALNLFDYMVKETQKSKLKVHRAPFGWNKKFALEIKSHPLAEMFRSYSSEERKAEKGKVAKKVDTSIVRKSDFAGLPETDHRIIGERLDLFSFQEVSPGMVYWHNNGYIVIKELMKFIRDKYEEYGYQEISTPAMANTALWHTSGHIDHYRENMFIIDANNQEVGLRPMGCPFAILVYKSTKHSYKDLPMRLAEFGTYYRNEISGALSGLFRVRAMTQDDGHIFVTEEQIVPEVEKTLKLVDDYYTTFGLKYKAKLSTMPDNHAGNEEEWEKATNFLKKALEKSKMKYEVKEKEGAFYGPKIDFDIKDSMGRDWQCATIQVDSQMPKRFNLSYVGEDGKEHMPTIIHRAGFGTLERFVGILIEHLQGKFPTWLAPVQVRVITISEQANEYAYKIYKEIKATGIRVDADATDKTLDYKIREAQNQKIPYMLILGKKEMESKKISVRGRSGKQKMGLSLEEFISSISKEIKERKNEQML